MCEINWEIVINAVGILVNAFLAWWIVSSIQKKQNNERSIKDHFIGEIKDLRTDYRSFLNSIYGGSQVHGAIIPSLKLLGIKTTHLLNTLDYSFSIDKGYLNSYLVEMNQIITDDHNFITCPNPSDKLELQLTSRDKLLRFQSNHQHKFNDLIMLVNECRYKNLYK